MSSLKGTKKGLSMREALLLCNNFGKPISFQGLKAAGQKYEFIHKLNKHWVVDAKKMFEYIHKSKINPKKGYIKISQAANIIKCSLNHCYKLVKKFKWRTIRCGIGIGKLYVNKSDVYTMSIRWNLVKDKECSRFVKK